MSRVGGILLRRAWICRMMRRDVASKEQESGCGKGENGSGRTASRLSGTSVLPPSHIPLTKQSPCCRSILLNVLKLQYGHSRDVQQRSLAEGYIVAHLHWVAAEVSPTLDATRIYIRMPRSTLQLSQPHVPLRQSVPARVMWSQERTGASAQSMGEYTLNALSPATAVTIHQQYSPLCLP